MVVGQSNLCAVALEAAGMGSADGMVAGLVLIGPPALEALSLDKPQEPIDLTLTLTLALTLTLTVTLTLFLTLPVTLT